MQSYRVTLCHCPFPGPLDVVTIGLKAANCEDAMRRAQAVTGATYAIEAYRRDDTDGGAALLNAGTRPDAQRPLPRPDLAALYARLFHLDPPPPRTPCTATRTRSAPAEPSSRAAAPYSDHRDYRIMQLCFRIGRSWQVNWLDVRDGGRLLEQDARIPDLLREQAA